MRILIVGAGIAGLTLAAKLRQQGRQPVVVERLSDYGDLGYAIGLYPLGSCVLHGLGVYAEFLARGIESRRYEITDHTGKRLRTMDLSALTSNAGPMVMLPRSDLIEVLRKACGDLPIRMDTTVVRIDQAHEVVHVIFGDKTEEDFDFVVGCDGIHSQVRTTVFGQQESFDTGWTAWTWWGRGGLFPVDTVHEYWGDGFFFGAYPVRERCMFCAVLPNDRIADLHTPTEKIRSVIAAATGEITARDESVHLAIEDAEHIFPWPMIDIRAREWFVGRVALCGDAAAAFLPTAGVGASNALRAASALADELSRADATLVPSALDLYVKRCLKIVWGNQDDSRLAARYMFVESRLVGWGRDEIIKHYPAQRMLSQIVESMRQPF